ncbi:ABC-type multidrug transport system, ATPase component [Halalkaliarchaeum sp. AArc-CO]|uniref:ABC transporter ATP-binding protein n=1 Tax=Halalkaliarchaeum sp. AArc-CO TaxID=2866381 RepID=UPI00217E4584|nr:ABC transporter ATP-binding protein [Halalkaliarchaeum sp. AArc-CO]UWG52185.1 ABC-type multidrug transport system, ATPase component [Halalkaliarchaeum sp. AArc-CO]
MAAIELSGVRKEFADVTAVRDLDLTVEEGEVYGFLGPNGAGKSTTINILLDFVRPSAGEVRVLGRDAHRESLAVRQRTGVLPEGFGVYDRLSGRQHVEFAIDSKDAADDPDELLSRVGLAADGARKAGGYSKGMRQRLALAMALVGEPDLLILDEPSSGLDPTGAKDMREIVREEVDRGATVFFSSHVLGQVEAVCDRVGILRDGRLVAEDSVEGLREAVGDDETLVITIGEGAEGVGEEGVAGATAAIRDLEGVSAVELDGDTLTVSCRGDAKTAVLSTLEEQGIDVDDFTTREASLEDLFLAYTEGEAGDSDGSPQAAETPVDREGSA